MKNNSRGVLLSFIVGFLTIIFGAFCFANPSNVNSFIYEHIIPDEKAEMIAEETLPLADTPASALLSVGVELMADPFDIIFTRVSEGNLIVAVNGTISTGVGLVVPCDRFGNPLKEEDDSFLHVVAPDRTYETWQGEGYLLLLGDA